VSYGTGLRILKAFGGFWTGSRTVMSEDMGEDTIGVDCNKRLAFHHFFTRFLACVVNAPF